jgi:hypothetical protein
MRKQTTRKWSRNGSTSLLAIHLRSLGGATRNVFRSVIPDGEEEACDCACAAAEVGEKRKGDGADNMNDGNSDG